MAQQLKTLMERLERVGSGKRVSADELDDLAAYGEEVQGWANELETKMADFAANVEMLHDEDTPREDRRELRAQMVSDAEEAAGALRAIHQYCY